MRLPLLRLVAVAAVVAGPPVAAGEANAKPVGFTVTDPAGDVRDPQVDLTAARLTYDRDTGVLIGGIVLAAPPTIQVMDSAQFRLGRAQPGSGRCVARDEVNIAIPDADDVAAGLPEPYAELFRDSSDDAIGFLPATTDGGTITFSSVESTPEVVGALEQQRFNCVEYVETAFAGTFETADEIGTQPLLSGRRPRCRALKRTVRAGRSVPFRCRGAGRRVEVHIFPKRGRDVFTGTERVRNGRFRVPTTRSMGDAAIISLWTQGTAFARFEVKIR